MNKAKSNKRRNDGWFKVSLFAEIVINYLLQLGFVESVWRHSLPTPRKRIQIHANMMIDEVVHWFHFSFFGTIAITCLEVVSKPTKRIFGVGRHNRDGWIIFREIHPCLPNFLPKTIRQFLEGNTNGVNVIMPRFAFCVFNNAKQNNSCSLEIIVAKFFPNLTKCFDVCD